MSFEAVHKSLKVSIRRSVMSQQLLDHWFEAFKLIGICWDIQVWPTTEVKQSDFSLLAATQPCDLKHAASESLAYLLYFK